MDPYIQVLLMVFAHLMQRYQSGVKMSYTEKMHILKGLTTLSTQFFSKYISNDKLGAPGLEISARGDVRVSGKALDNHENSVHEVFQDAQVRHTVPHVSRRVLEVGQKVADASPPEHRDAFQVARVRSQSGQRKAR
jgi:hypothetical protein